MDVIAEPSVAIRETPRAPGSLRFLAVPPADAREIAQRLEPGHPPAATAASIVVVAATATLSVSALAEIREFMRRHPGALTLVVDRMDDAGCEYGVFDAQRQRLLANGITPDLFIPAISSTGEGIVSGPDRVDWYRGPTLMQWLGCPEARPAADRSKGSR
jgi:sulfate adenylyltransferase subunit 1 (EFTu-like GTPase family)